MYLISLYYLAGMYDLRQTDRRSGPCQTLDQRSPGFLRKMNYRETKPECAFLGRIGPGRSRSQHKMGRVLSGSGPSA